MYAPSVDIAIVNYRSATDTLQALARLAQWRHGTIWLVDNSAHEADMAADTAALRHASVAMPWVRLLTPGENLGFGRACNLAFAQSRSEFFLLLNPDARIAPDDILQLTKTLSAQARLGAVAPKIFWNDEHSFVLPAAFAQTPWYRVALALMTHSQPLARWAALRGLKRAMRQMASPGVAPVDFLAGAVLLLRRTAVQSAGGLFDPDYFMFYEDSDLSLRLRRAGHRLAVAPEAIAVHEYRHKDFKARLMAQSEQLYFAKQYPTFFRLSGGLTRVGALARSMVAAQWFVQLPKPVHSAAEFAQLTDGMGVMALSPSLQMMPAVFRPSFAQARCLNEKDWALLEPSCYVALLCTEADTSRRIWVYFERAASGG